MISADDYILCADCTYENRLLNGQTTTQTMFKDIYRFIPDTFISSPECSVVWNDNDAEGPSCFVRYLKMFCGKTTITLKTTASVLYSIQFF